MYVVVAVVLMQICSAQLPCTNNRYMSDLGGRRKPDFVAPVDDFRLCDYRLEECEYALKFNVSIKTAKF